MKCGAIILAAGRGKRFGGRKQFLELNGKPLWKHVYDKCAKAFGSAENIVCVGVDVLGGETRSGSVAAGLESLAPDTERVLIAEAARPLVTVGQLRELLEDKAPSSTFVMPLVNTPIMRDGSYLERSDMYDLLVPQAFDFAMLRDAYATGKYEDITDDTRVMWEEYGIRPHFIETGDNLFKVTYPRDMAVIESLVAKRDDLL